MVDCVSLSWIRIEPPPISLPFNTRSYAFARTAAGSVSNNSNCPGFGEVKGWCIAWKCPVSSSSSNNGKSMTHKGANSFAFLSPSLDAISIRNALSCVLVLCFSPDNTQIRSPGLAPVTSAHFAKSP